ncbi:DUF2073 domain-containing protein [archaeon]|jgi:hypothetical protein|nr:DUF2073 domain-containing protein [archaeon]MBT4021842.1 DUF2073 domain-containing protein [archaeon]MBT4272137.1 DUF2073 domain-containing protein [archaeon]MBT4460318.1 DUF2073 domain-containing protein [archaeon]MBT5423276.1 DUF2073 domain-containing protein [archaeon]
MLTLQFISYNQIANLEPDDRIKKLLSFVKQDKIVLLEGRLRDEEEADLIRKTMEDIDEKFTGIELGVVHPQDKDSSLYKQIHAMLVRLLLGNRNGFTIIGPANIIQEIKKDPDKIQLLMKDQQPPPTKKTSKKKSKK